jgi:DNA-binding NarL/FixJ family response regulator
MPNIQVAVLAESEFSLVAMVQTLSNRPGMRIVWTGTDATAFPTRFAEPPHVVVTEVDFERPRTAGDDSLNPIGVIRRICEADVTMRVVALLHNPRLIYVTTLLRMCVGGLVARTGNCLPHIVQAVEAVAAERSYLCPVVRPLVHGAQVLPDLTDTEIRVVRLLARTAQFDETDSSRIASELFIAPGTLKVHLSHIRQKLDVGSTREIVQYCRQIGLV